MPGSNCGETTELLKLGFTDLARISLKHRPIQTGVSGRCQLRFCTTNADVVMRMRTRTQVENASSSSALQLQDKSKYLEPNFFPHQEPSFGFSLFKEFP